jgi:oleate hydratase
MWSTMFSFQPWHSAIEMRRYLRRFIHLFPGFSRIKGILRTRYNQFDSIIAPVAEWLAERGVAFETGREVVDVDIRREGEARRAVALKMADGEAIAIRPEDRVYITLGSMTDASTRGDNTTAPPVPGDEGASWRLWRKLAAQHADFGNPEPFAGQIDKSTWTSFTVTMDSPAFFDHMEAFTGNRTGTGGLVTIAGSGWILSVVMFHQPHFRDQAKGKYVFWGYGLRGDRPGDFVKKPMWEATGDEIMAELIGQLKLEGAVKAALEQAVVVTARMPHITSQFMPRKSGDRPRVRPEGARNFAFVGQFCEMPRDTVFTVEYSVRSAITAVSEMTGWTAPPPPVVRTDRDPVVLMRAAKVLFGV